MTMQFAQLSLIYLIFNIAYFSVLSIWGADLPVGKYVLNNNYCTRIIFFDHLASCLRPLYIIIIVIYEGNQCVHEIHG